MNRYWRFTIIIMTIMAGRLASAAEFEIISPRSSEVFAPESQESETLEPNQAKRFRFDRILWIRSKDYLPVLVIPVDAKNSQIKIDAPKIADVVSQLAQADVDKMLSEVFIEISVIQKLTRQRNLTESKNKIDLLMSKYPRLTYLKFILASQKLLEGDRTSALRIGEEALSAFPDNEDGKAFVKQLKGAKP